MGNAVTSGSVLFVLSLLASSLAGQVSYGCCDFRDWATYGSDNLLRYHPTAHGMGGIGMGMVARGPWFSDGIRRGPVWRRLAVVAILGAAWQANNLKEIRGYRWDYAAYDISTDILGAGLLEIIFPVRQR